MNTKSAFAAIRTGQGAVDRDGAQRFVSVQGSRTWAPRWDVDRRVRLDLVQEVARHGRAQIAPAYDEVDMGPRPARKTAA